MNPFDEQEQQINDTTSFALDELRRKKLYTWYDINKWSWPETFTGIGIGLFIAFIISILYHN